MTKSVFFQVFFIHRFLKSNNEKVININKCFEREPEKQRILSSLHKDGILQFGKRDTTKSVNSMIAAIYETLRKTYSKEFNQIVDDNVNCSLLFNNKCEDIIYYLFQFLHIKSLLICDQICCNWFYYSSDNRCISNNQLILNLNLLNNNRFEYFENECKEKAELLKKKEIKSDQDAENINSSNKLKEKNDTSKDGNVKIKIAILIDATGSMSGLINKLKNTVQIIFERITDVLETNGISSKSFEIQFMAYRSYNAPSDLILQVSGWSNNATQLKNFLSKVNASYGAGDEAIEVALQHCNRLIDENGDIINCVIIIGDAPPTQTREKLKQYRTNYTRCNLNTHPYCSVPAFYQDEVIKLKNKGVKIDTFYMDKWAKTEFEWMAKNGGGQSSMLDVNSSCGTELLMNALCVEILSCL